MSIFSEDFIQTQNRPLATSLASDYATLGAQLARSGVDIEAITARAAAFAVAVPSWGVGTGGTRFARFPGPAEPRNVFEKLEDCATVMTPAVVLGTKASSSGPAPSNAASLPRSAWRRASVAPKPPIPSAAYASMQASTAARTGPACGTTAAWFR